MIKADSYRLRSAHVLIVGGAGFVGSNLTNELLKYIYSGSITIIDNLLSSEEFNIPDNRKIKFIKGSVCDNKVLGNIKDNYDYIFHLATFHGNQNSIFDPIKDHDNNSLTTLKLFNHIKNFKKLKKVVYSSAGCSVSEKTFGKAKATVEGEVVNITQDSPYSISKILGEFYSVYFYKRHGLSTIRARFQNVYGPNEILGSGKWRGTYATVWRNVIPTFIYKAIKGWDIPLENGGVATRDFIFVEDICKGLILCALKGKPGDVYNLASGKEVSIKELAAKIIKFTQSNSKIVILPKRVWDNSGKRFGSTSKSKKTLGFKAETNLDTGLKITLLWTLSNLNLIEKTISKHNKHMSIKLDVRKGIKK